MPQATKAALSAPDLEGVDQEIFRHVQAIVVSSSGLNLRRSCLNMVEEKQSESKSKELPATSSKALQESSSGISTFSWVLWIVTSIFFVVFWIQEWRSPGFWYKQLHGDTSIEGRALKILSDNPLIGKFGSPSYFVKSADIEKMDTMTFCLWSDIYIKITYTTALSRSCSNTAVFLVMSIYHD